MNTISAKFRLVASALLLIGGATTALGQACIDRPFIVRPVIEKSVIERPVMIRAIIMKPIIEQPNFVRAVVERGLIEQPRFEKPVYDWCGDAYYAVDAATEGESPSLNRSMRGMLRTGEYTPGASFKRAYLKAVRTPPPNPGSSSAQLSESAGSCCGEDPSPRIASSRPRLARSPASDPFAAYRKKLAMTTPSPAVKSAATIASTATASAVMATTMVVPRGSR